MKVDVKMWWEKYTQLKWEKRMLVLVTVISIVPITIHSLLAKKHENVMPVQPVRNVDTYIPRGFVLVPIEVQNYEALDSILGRYGVVDLFQSAGPDGSHQRAVASNVRILRAPQNPSHFAVLVREDEAARLLRYGASFTVIVKSRTASGTKFVEAHAPEPVAKRRIVYEGE